MVVCNTPSTCLLGASRGFSSEPVPRQPIVTGTSVLAIKYKDGIMMAADNLGLSTPDLRHGLLTGYILYCSFLWFPCTFQRRAASTTCGRLYRRRCKWRYVRLSIPSAYPRWPRNLGGNKCTRWAYTWSGGNSRVFVAGDVRKAI
jgi:hypothetical protein